MTEIYDTGQVHDLTDIYLPQCFVSARQTTLVLCHSLEASGQAKLGATDTAHILGTASSHCYRSAPH